MQVATRPDVIIISEHRADADILRLRTIVLSVCAMHVAVFLAFSLIKMRSLDTKQEIAITTIELVQPVVPQAPVVPCAATKTTDKPIAAKLTPVPVPKVQPGVKLRPVIKPQITVVAANSAPHSAPLISTSVMDATSAGPVSTAAAPSMINENPGKTVEKPTVHVVEQAAATTEGSLAAWQGSLMGKLHRFKRYPTSAQELGQQGSVSLRFRVNHHGKIISASVEKSSGVSVLDEEALALIRRVEPLAPPPIRSGDNPLEMVVPVQFYLQ